MASTSFHLSSVEPQPQDLKTMTTSVDRLFGDFVDSIHQATNAGGGSGHSGGQLQQGVKIEPLKPSTNIQQNQYSKTVHSRVRFFRNFEKEFLKFSEILI